MLDPERDGGPAFPQGDLSAYGIGPSENNAGMSLRDYFAAAVMTGLAAHPEGWTQQDRTMAKAAYDVAEQMLHERQRRLDLLNSAVEVK
jgi:hypothetical protein